MDKRFLDKVVEQIVSETRVDHEEERIHAPFTYPIDSPVFLSIIRTPHTISTPIFVPTNFTNHCKDIYGLNKEEIEYVWGKYGNIINGKLKSNKNLNESNGMNKKFLDKVIDQIVSEVKVDHNNKTVVTPFSNE